MAGQYILKQPHPTLLSSAHLRTHTCAHYPQQTLPPSPALRPQVAGQYILKQGDEVAFVLHTNLKSGELNAQRVRRTKEAPEPPPAPGESGWQGGKLASGRWL